LSVSAWPF